MLNTPKNRNILQNYSEAIRAILLASALHNLEGIDTPSLQPNYESKDGAGGIVGDLAVRTAKQSIYGNEICIASCWSSITLIASIPTQSVLVPLNFFVVAGERVRIAISVSNQPDTPDSPSYGSTMARDVNLYVKDPTQSSYIAASATRDNAWEMVDFIATRSGIHTLEVSFPQGYTAGPTAVGIAIVNPNAQRRFVYMPLITR
jgi:hypothetical protein